MESAESLINHHFLCTMEGKKGIYECQVMRLSPDGDYVELRIASNLYHDECFQWITRYDFGNKIKMLALLDKGEGT